MKRKVPEEHLYWSRWSSKNKLGKDVKITSEADYSDFLLPGLCAQLGD